MTEIEFPQNKNKQSYVSKIFEFYSFCHLIVYKDYETTYFTHKGDKGYQKKYLYISLFLLKIDEI